jgi:quinol monooxygenase YgiN
MHSLNINFKLRPKRIAEFSRILEDEVIPLLQREKGFDDVISFIAADRNEAVAISLWEKKEDAEADNQKTYPEILRAFAGVIEGTPKVQIFEVESQPRTRLVPGRVAQWFLARRRRKGFSTRCPQPQRVILQAKVSAT